MTISYQVWAISPYSKNQRQKKIADFEKHQWQWAEKLASRLEEEGYEEVELVIEKDEYYDDEIYINNEESIAHR